MCYELGHLLEIIRFIYFGINKRLEQNVPEEIILAWILPYSVLFVQNSFK